MGEGDSDSVVGEGYEMGYSDGLTGEQWLSKTEINNVDGCG